MQRIRGVLFLFLIVGGFKALGFVVGVFRSVFPQKQGRYLPETLRLYRRGPQGTDFAWIYEIGDRLFIDRGRLGEMADRRNVPISEWPMVSEEIAQAEAEGFEEISEEDMSTFQIQYRTRREFASGEELEKRNQVRELLDEHFALTGQGFWIDSTTGMSTMECSFRVVDFDVAKACVAALLVKTTYGDYLSLQETGGFRPTTTERAAIN